MVDDIAAGLKANLDAARFGVNVSRFPLTNPTPPVFHMWPTTIMYHRAMQMGLNTMGWRVQLIQGSILDHQAKGVYEFMDPAGVGSVRAALEADRTLGGLIETLQVEECSGLGYGLTLDNRPQLTADWTVTLHLGST